MGRVLLCAGIVLCVANGTFAQDPAQDFKQNCSSCHTIGGGRLTGPDLKNVLERKERDWLLNFIVDPGSVLASGDPYAAKLLEEARGVPMPNVAGMSKARANSLLDLIAAESKLEKSRFAGVQLSDRPMTPEDVRLGRRIFLGETRLKNGGAACMSCHTVGGLGWLGGGRLGPDLTLVFEKYQDRKRLGAWLSAPATETMLPTFKDHPLEAEEILPLIAFFRDAAATGDEDRTATALILVLLGLVGAGGAFSLFGTIWKNRFQGVRRKLVEKARQELVEGTR